MSRVDEILDFWLGELDEHGLAGDAQQKLWWTASEEVDKEIEERFSGDRDKAVSGELESWLGEARSRLAFILLIDQFSRNIFRGSARAFEADSIALGAAREAIDLKMDRPLRSSERSFVYVPLMHSESLTDQHLCVRMFDVLVEEWEGKAKESAKSSRDFALQHLEIVDRFGRFPHRNEILGRSSTKEELAFLKEPGSSF